jgi:tripartite-type tricarboxylate transporter receptor subunit TctC
MAPHLAGVLFKRMTGIEMTHVPFRTGAQQDVIAGRVDVMFVVGGSGIILMRAGQVRVLAVTGTQRLAAAPSVPTAAEAGVPGFDVPTWWGLFVPARTAPAVIAKIHADTAGFLGQAMSERDFRISAQRPSARSRKNLRSFSELRWRSGEL